MDETSNETGRSASGQRLAGDERVIYVMPSQTATGNVGDEIDVRQLWSIVWSGRWIVAGITTLVTVAGLAYALLATEWYRAEVVLSPVEEESKLGLADQLGGLAGLAGISSSGGESVEPVAVLGSRAFARELIEELGLTVVFFADEWDYAQKRWKSKNPDDWPDVRDAIIYFDEKVRKVNQDRKTGLVTLTIDWTDPEVASEWANLLVKRLNDRMRERALAESERNVRFLQEQLAATSVVSLQQSIGRLLESELQKLMLARGNEEFSFRVVDRADPPKYRHKPKRFLIVVLAAIVGGFVSVIAVLIRHSPTGHSATPDLT